jgi:hypothetical protein
MALFSKATVCGRSLAGVADSNPAGDMLPISCECCVLLGRDLCDRPITHPEESYRMWCVIKCDQVQVCLPTPDIR